MHDMVLNGQPLQTQHTRLQALLEQQGFDFTTAFACAVNQCFVPRPQWPQHKLQAGDVIEVVSPVTGG